MSADIDIDFADRSQILSLIPHRAAQQIHDGQSRLHNSGVYFQNIPYDAVLGAAAIDYNEAEQRGYFKIDFLNMSVYQMIRDPDHYEKMLRKPVPWHRLSEPGFVSRCVHIGNHSSLLTQMPEPVDSIPRMAMFLAVIRPGKRHLAGKQWREVAQQVWTPGSDGYMFKKSHAVSYAQLVALHMNLIDAADQSD